MVGIVAGEAVAQLRVVAVHDNPGEDTEHCRITIEQKLIEKSF